MLQKVILENFQAHEMSVIEFTEGINVICGASDQGKSSVIRAIRWALENRPSGFSFKREGAKTPTRVTLVFDNGTILRERSEVDNFYRITKPDGEVVELKALRTDVPEEVKTISGFGEYNIQSQSGKAFLIDESDGDVAKKINTLSGVSIMDSILKESNSRLRAEKAKEVAAKELLSDLMVKRKRFRNLDSASRKFKKVEEMHAELNEYREYHSVLNSLVVNFLELEKIPTIPIDLVEIEMKNLTHSVEEWEEYAEISNGLKKKIADLKTVLETLQAYAMLKEATATLNKAKKALPALVDIKNRADELKVCLANFKKYDEGFKLSVRSAKKAIDDLREFKKEYTVCPVCKKQW